MASWNEPLIQEFHAKDGKGVGQFGNRLVLLTTTGARSGKEGTTPLMYHRDGRRRKGPGRPVPAPRVRPRAVTPGSG